ncbi:hypothetical protein [Lacibacter sp. H407]|uniref:hypothetical protein n=1 Tax=Lacibacter sp. H407 TaxID=3133423 RepID=UPI0030BDD47F
MKPIVALSFFLLFVHQIAISQANDSGIARIITNIRQLHELNPSEKCFLHTDKQFYQPGETVWFKTYLTVNDLPVVLSNVVYTDFSDATGKIYAKSMWKAEKGTATGNIFVPDTLATGIYRIRSYSLWMLNEPTTINEQFVFILGKKDQSKSYHLPASAVKVTFFPESGSLVESIENSLAFRITDVNSVPVTDVTVDLIDETKKVVGKPAVFENGTGLVKFTPEPGKKYSLLVSLNLNNRQTFPVPEIVKNGMALSVSNLSASKIFVQANASEKFMDENKVISVVGQQYGKTVFTQTFNFDEAQNASIINKKTLAEGLLQVIALNSQLQPIAERWVWVEMPVTKNLTITTDSLSFEPKGKNKWQLNYSGTEIPELSVSIIPADLPAYSFVSHPDIRAYQLLHSNNKQPGFVQNNIPPLSAELKSLYLDALLLTVQPSRFSWQQVSTGKQPDLRYFFETGISIRGTVKKDKESMQFDSSKIDIITKAADSSTIFSTAKLDKKGAFAVNDLHFRKQASVYLQATNKEKKKSKLEFELLPGYLDTLGNKITPASFRPAFKELTTAKDASNNFVKNYSVSALGKELTEIVVKGKNKQEIRLDSLNKTLTSDLFRESEFTKAPDQNFGYISFAQLFEQEFFGFRFNTGYEKIGGMDGTPASGLASGDMISYYLNEQPISADELNFINPNEVVLVKVNRNANLHLGQMGPGPSVLIYTVRKNYNRSGFEASQLTGYSIPLQFYNPDFSRSELRNTEDRRTTLLWQPQVKFENGKATIRFFNNDYTKKYKLVVQGIDQKGNLYYLEKIIE